MVEPPCMRCGQARVPPLWPTPSSPSSMMSPCNLIAPTRIVCRLCCSHHCPQAPSSYLRVPALMLWPSLIAPMPCRSSMTPLS
ncbi:hypothetical protein GUJ93_ZPchr0010g10362 [Zizania palustris]|uniref:Uncharacterized protein n=1 Tax=Zizania palustris TaxID=103762 RepID=A0A8J6BR28_ZIZPA|nr:hypothetical protein GUJ93_ZPchr0010g10362 [Zizania palustris]